MSNLTFIYSFNPLLVVPKDQLTHLYFPVVNDNGEIIQATEYSFLVPLGRHLLMDSLLYNVSPFCMFPLSRNLWERSIAIKLIPCTVCSLINVLNINRTEVCTMLLVGGIFFLKFKNFKLQRWA